MPTDLVRGHWRVEREHVNKYYTRNSLMCPCDIRYKKLANNVGIAFVSNESNAGITLYVCWEKSSPGKSVRKQNN